MDRCVQLHPINKRTRPPRIINIVSLEGFEPKNYPQALF